jgi:hypothetical protein
MVVELIGIIIIVAFAILDGWGFFMLFWKAIMYRELKPKIREPLGGTIRRLEA